jgi:DNA-binding NtrC family response regulator
MTDVTERKTTDSLPVRTTQVEVLDGPMAGTVARGADVLTVGSADGNDLVLNDRYCSRYHLEIKSTPSGFLLTDHGSTNGTYLGPARIEKGTVPPATVIRVGGTSIRVVEGAVASVELLPGDSVGGFCGRAPATRRLMAQVVRAAAAQAAVLLVGESGTGKEVLARALHDLGPRSREPFEVVDCGALVPALVASELFGHERGAFTGADRQHIGAFERAGSGTVFLDEIGELPVAVQASLLGALERRRFRRVGGQKDIAVDARVISATHRDLRSQVNDGTFRLDLYYRLAVIALTIPPLRERAEDLPLLVEHFLEEMGCSESVSDLLSPAALAALGKHRWEGNVRELRNMVEAMLAMGELPALSVRDGAAPANDADPIQPLLDQPYKNARATLLHQFEARYLPHILTRAENNVARAARDAGMDRSHLIELLQKHRLR